MDLGEKALKLHEKARGKIELAGKVKVESDEDMSLVYTPGVAAVCTAIAKDEKLAYKYTNKWNSVAIVTDGTRVLGLGDIGPLAALPVMEGKAVLYKKFGGVDAYPVCLAVKSADEIVAVVKALAPNYAAINLEDIESPKCFEIQERLDAELGLPVYHDDRHGTAIVALAGLINALKITGKNKNAKIVVNGAGAAGTGIVELLAAYGFKDLVVCDTHGAIYAGRAGLDAHKQKLARMTNMNAKKGSLAEIIAGADVFIGASAPDVLTEKMVRSMAHKPIVFALANPVPEISPELAAKAGAFVYATGRSDFPNQINNAVASPGFFRGLLDSSAKKITTAMMLAAAEAIAAVVEKPSPSCIVPKLFDRKLESTVAKAVMDAA
ncbi:MAG: NADP-dependent malic enzyme [Candidatus Burarchaeum sp.]|nr:NADP-dependent malic enzyme [Candidatus Burarchaeum sp.]MDO8339791.1 NADP-dependent malic enzyme [Candidatus Burarchaeum sp.]